MNVMFKKMMTMLKMMMKKKKKMLKKGNLVRMKEGPMPKLSVSRLIASISLSVESLLSVSLVTSLHSQCLTLYRPVVCRS
jgi:hypothetical protein